MSRLRPTGVVLLYNPRECRQQANPRLWGLPVVVLPFDSGKDLEAQEKVIEEFPEDFIVVTKHGGESNMITERTIGPTKYNRKETYGKS